MNQTHVYTHERKTLRSFLTSPHITLDDLHRPPHSILRPDSLPQRRRRSRIARPVTACVMASASRPACQSAIPRKDDRRQKAAGSMARRRAARLFIEEPIAGDVIVLSLIGRLWDDM
jgi:hypothetical protein